MEMVKLISRQDSHVKVQLYPVSLQIGGGGRGGGGCHVYVTSNRTQIDRVKRVVNTKLPKF